MTSRLYLRNAIAAILRIVGLAKHRQLQATARRRRIAGALAFACAATAGCGRFGFDWTGEDEQLSADASVPLPTSAATLIAHWPFDGNARDVLGRFDGEERNAVSYVAGRDGQALDVTNGSNETSAHVRVASGARNGTTPGPLSPDSVSVALWMKGHPENSIGQVFERGRPCLTSYDLRLEGATLSAGFNPGTSRASSCASRQELTTTIDTSTWQHVVFTAERSADYSQAHLRLYLNGSLVASDDLAGSFPNGGRGDGTDQRRYLVVGRNYLDAQGGATTIRPFDGQIDDLRLYKGILTAQEVAALYASY